MRGFCKCDLCGSVYNESDNPVYDGITVWRKNKNGENKFPMSGSELNSEDGNFTTNIPAIMDVCPSCFEKFYKWIRESRKNIKTQ